MKLAVYVLGRDVAVLEQAGDFKSVLTYHAGVAEAEGQAIKEVIEWTR
jgi:hypothetical protein